MLGPKIVRVANRLATYWSMPVYDQPVTVRGDYTDVIFLHHSTGQNLIAEGNLRARLTERGFRFWDHDYNHIGLIDPTGTPTGATFRVPGAYGRGNTDVDGLATLFDQPLTDPPANAFSRLLQHEIIIVKSCFPNNAIGDATMQQEQRQAYLRIRDAMDRHPDRLFILLTTPPLHPLATDAAEAARAQDMANWLTSDDYLAGHPNVFVFDFYDALADRDGTLRREYQRRPGEADSHPNTLANEIIAPQLAAFVEAARTTYLQAVRVTTEEAIGP